MKVSYNWLKEYVAFDLSPQELAKALTARGVVVEILTHLNQGVEGVKVGRVVKMERHPNADSLWVTQTDVGGEVLTILTGAQNVVEGALVPAAIPGAKLPGGKQMAAKELRGILSHGMLCSAPELGIDGDGEGIMLLPDDGELAPGMDVADVLGLNDWVLELDLTANYASHCQSMVGVAQEVAAIVGGQVAGVELLAEGEMVEQSASPYPEADESADQALMVAEPVAEYGVRAPESTESVVRTPETKAPAKTGTNIKRMIGLEIQAVDLCDRYAARIVRGIKVGESPAWLQARLRAAGMRPINNVVDISNYVMLELGQPLHTFDYQKIKGQEIIVRRAEAGEKMVTLDGQERTLDPEILVIADRQGAIAMAGVMGAENSEVTESTTEILIESAHFDNINNRRTALRQNLPSEASRRFTKGVDPSGAPRAADRAAFLLTALCGGQAVQGVVDLYPRPSVPSVILLRPAKVNAHLGMAIPTERMVAHLEALGMAVLSPEALALDLVQGAPEDEEEGADLSGRPVWTALHQVSPVPTEIHAYEGWASTAWAAVEAAGESLGVDGEDEVNLEETLVVVVPTRRLDISIEIDLVEEIARSEGFDAIPTALPVLATRRGGRSVSAEQVLRTRRILAASGLDEVITHSLTHPRIYDRLQLAADATERNVITLANPMYEDRATLRTLLLPGLIETLRHNANRQTKNVGIFELSTVYLPKGHEGLPEERRHLAIALMGDQALPGWSGTARPADFFLLKGLLEYLVEALDIPAWAVKASSHPSFHPGRQAALYVGDELVGHFGELHPVVPAAWDLDERVYAAELDFATLMAGARALRPYRSIPKVPAVTRDLAMLVPDALPAAQVAATIREAAGATLESLFLFDLYQGEHVKPGHRSLAYRITYRDPERTLTDADIEAAHGAVRQALGALGIELRS
ncbi:MAG TPA: phenylalanine--tRNA ligase subunit beta [Symbiobacteriaceae bacterium]|nr:phenylalanine--tRNA ligase subunit beta [Symbiobacteriaceae bacterium]